MLAPLAILLACSADSTLAMKAAPSFEAPAAYGACDVPVPEASAAADAAAEPGVLLYADGVGSTVLSPDAVEVVTDAVRWAEIRAGTAWRRDDIPEVDLRATWLLVVHGYAAASCSMGVAAVDRWESAPMAVHVEVAFDDRSATCEVTCDAEAHALVVVAVPAGTALTTCARVEGSCGG